jgi:hypothetical protein
MEYGQERIYARGGFRVQSNPQPQKKFTKLTQDSIWEWVTVVETGSGDRVVLRPVIFKNGTAHYKVWYAGLKENNLTSFVITEKRWNIEKTSLIWRKESFDQETTYR